MTPNPGGAPQPYTPRAKRPKRPAVPGPAIPKLPKPGAQGNPGRKLFGAVAAAKFKSRKGA